MAEYLIQGETLTAIANAIRDFSDVGEITMTPTDMAGNIERVYDAGYDTGYADGRAEGSSGDLEALGALCDWQIMTDSNSFPVVTVVNLHPSYYLHCQISDAQGCPWWDCDTDEDISNSLVVPPDECKTVYGDNPLSYIQPIYIDAVRWSENGI